MALATSQETKPDDRADLEVLARVADRDAVGRPRIRGPAMCRATAARAFDATGRDQGWVGVDRREGPGHLLLRGRRTHPVVEQPQPFKTRTASSQRLPPSRQIQIPPEQVRHPSPSGVPRRVGTRAGPAVHAPITAPGCPRSARSGSVGIRALLLRGGSTARRVSHSRSPVDHQPAAPRRKQYAGATRSARAPLRTRSN